MRKEIRGLSGIVMDIIDSGHGFYLLELGGLQSSGFTGYDYAITKSRDYFPGLLIKKVRESMERTCKQFGLSFTDVLLDTRIEKGNLSHIKQKIKSNKTAPSALWVQPSRLGWGGSALSINRELSTLIEESNSRGSIIVCGERRELDDICRNKGKFYRKYGQRGRHELYRLPKTHVVVSDQDASKAIDGMTSEHIVCKPSDRARGKGFIILSKRDALRFFNEKDEDAKKEILISTLISSNNRTYPISLAEYEYLFLKDQRDEVCIQEYVRAQEIKVQGGDGVERAYLPVIRAVFSITITNHDIATKLVDAYYKLPKPLNNLKELNVDACKSYTVDFEERQDKVCSALINKSRKKLLETTFGPIVETIYRTEVSQHSDIRMGYNALKFRIEEDGYREELDDWFLDVIKNPSVYLADQNKGDFQKSAYQLYIESLNVSREALRKWLISDNDFTGELADKLLHGPHQRVEDKISNPNINRDVFNILELTLLEKIKETHENIYRRDKASFFRCYRNTRTNGAQLKSLKNILNHIDNGGKRTRFAVIKSFPEAKQNLVRNSIVDPKSETVS